MAALDHRTTTVEAAAQYERQHGARAQMPNPGIPDRIVDRYPFNRLDYRALLTRLLHPTQVRIIEQMAAVETPWSPKGLAGALDEPLGNVSHHVRRLAAAGVIVLEHTEPRRGATAHFYVLAGEVRR